MTITNPADARESEDAFSGMGSVIHAATGLVVPGLHVEVLGPDDDVVASVVTDEQGHFPYPLQTRAQPSFRVTEPDLPITVDGAEVSIGHGERPTPDDFALLAEFAAGSRRARVREVAAGLLNPAVDSPLRMFPVSVRLALLTALAERLGVHHDHGERLLADDRYLNLGSIADGLFDIFQPHPERDVVFEWPTPDEEAYRDYLRGVFVLYAHQQAVGFSGDPTQWRDIIVRQLAARFFQDFLTQVHTPSPLNLLLIPVVKQILTDTAFGFGVPPGSIPAQGSLSIRSYLDKLLALASVSPAEFANRYRLPLDEPDETMSTPVLLNTFTLSRILSDTAQGPLEEKPIVPQLPGFEGKPLLWKEVVGAAPFFLRYDEWLERHRRFFAENHFSLRTQMLAGSYGEPWMDGKTEAFLKFHSTSTSPMSSYNNLFGSIEEVHRSAAFLLFVGRADAKLFEFLTAFDKGDFRAALRLLDEGAALLRSATPKTEAGENWEPDEGFSGRKLSFAARRQLVVTDIGQLTGEPQTYPIRGFEPFFQLARTWDLWTDGNIPAFLQNRGLAARLVRYLRTFVVPILRARILLELGDYVAAITTLARVSGFYVGIADADTPTGMAYDGFNGQNRRFVHQKKTLPYTVRLSYGDDRSLLPPKPFAQQLFFIDMPQPEMKPDDLHALEVRYLAMLQGDVMLRWAEALYRTDDASNVERARELYKGVLFLHDIDPGTLAFSVEPSPPPTEQNPRLTNQIERARLGLFQIESGLNFYGYRDTLVPTLRFGSLIDAARRWSSAAKGAQNDYLAYLNRIEQLDLDLLAARAQLEKAQAAAQIAAEQIEIAKTGVAVAQRLVKEVQRQIDAKKKEIEEADSFFGQFGAYLKGMKDSVASLIEVGTYADAGATSTGALSDGQTKAAMKTLGKEAASGVGTSAGLATVGAMGTFVVLSTMSLQGMADAATRRAEDLKILTQESMVAAQAAVRVQERLVTIAQLQASIAATDVTYAGDLITYHAERFLNRDFWSALAAVSRTAMSRQLDLAAQASWLAERALAYETGRQLAIIRLDYPNPKMRDIGGVDRLILDLTELEAVRISSIRLSMPIKRTYSLARDLPVALGALKSTGKCIFTLDDADLIAAHPGTFAHRIRAVTVSVEAPGTAVLPKGMLINRGISFLRREPGGPNLPLVRYEDGLPISDFQLRPDMAVHGLPNETLLPFEGSGFATTWELEFPVKANPALGRLSDVVITFDLRAGYDGRFVPVTPPAGIITQAFMVSALNLDTKGLSSLRGPGASGKVTFDLADILSHEGASQPVGGNISNIAVLLPGINTGSYSAQLRTPGVTVPFTIKDGVASSNAAHLSDGVAANVQPLNSATGINVARRLEVTIDSHGPAQRLDGMRDLLLWVEYQHTL